MPYVNVWVDEPTCECECDGTCERSQDADRLEDCIEEAIHALRLGEPERALLILRGEEVVRRRSDLKELYERWKTKGLSGFLPYCGQPTP
jgi:hypothetical protein